MAVNTIVNIPPANEAFYDRNLLERAVPDFVHDLFADRKSIPTGESSKLKVRKYPSKEPAMVPLSEAVTPEGGTITPEDVEYELEQYGDYLTYSDWVDLTNLDPTLTEFGKILAEQAGRTIDQVRRDAYNAGTYVRRASGAASRSAIAAVITTTDLKYVERALLASYNKYFSEMVDPQNGYATSPTRAAFFCIAHTDAKTDIEDLSGFVSVEKYANSTKTYPTEIGQWGNFRFLVSPIAKKWADSGGSAGSALKYTTSSSACDVYSTLIFSPHAVCTSDLAGNGLKNIIHPRGSGGASIPLDQYGTTGWVAFLAQGILDDARLYRIEHGVSDLV